MIDWYSDNWGDPDTCVHLAANGSWVADRHDDEPVD